MSKFVKTTLTPVPAETVSKALQPRLAYADVPHRYFLAPPPQTQATQGVAERQRLVVYSLETARPAAIAFLVRNAITTAKSPVDLAGVDQQSWGLMDRWWILNEIIDRGGTVPLYASREAALAALESEGKQ